MVSSAGSWLAPPVTQSQVVGIPVSVAPQGVPVVSAHGAQPAVAAGGEGFALPLKGGGHLDISQKRNSGASAGVAAPAGAGAGAESPPPPYSLQQPPHPSAGGSESIDGFDMLSQFPDAPTSKPTPAVVMARVVPAPAPAAVAGAAPDFDDLEARFNALKKV